MRILRGPRRAAAALLAVVALGAVLLVLLDNEDSETVVASTGTPESPSAPSAPGSACGDPPFHPSYLPSGWDPALADREIITAEDGIRSTWWQPSSSDDFIRVVDGHSTFPQVPELTQQMVVLGQPAWIRPFTADGGFSVEFQACGRVWSLNSQGIGKAELRRVAEGLQRSSEWSDARTETALTLTPRSGPTGLGVLVEGRGFGDLAGASPDGVPVYLVRRDGTQELRGLVGHARPQEDGTFRLAGTVPATLTPGQPGDEPLWETTPGSYEVVVGARENTPTGLAFEVESLVPHTLSYPHRILLGCGQVSTFLGGHDWVAQPLSEHADLSGPTPGFFQLQSEDDADFLLGDYQNRPPIRFRRLPPGEAPPPAAPCRSEGPVSKGPAPVPPPCPAGATTPSFESGRYCGPEAPAGNGLGPDGQCTGTETGPACGPGAELGKYYAYTLPLRCDGLAHFNGRRWYSMLPPPTDGGTMHVWMRLDPNGSAGWISSQGAVGFRPDEGQKPEPCRG